MQIAIIVRFTLVAYVAAFGSLLVSNTDCHAQSTPAIQLAQARSQTKPKSKSKRKSSKSKKSTRKPLIRNFEDAYIDGYKKFQVANGLKRKLATAKTAEERTTLGKQFAAALKRTAAGLERASQMGSVEDDGEKFYSARYLLAYVYTLMKTHNYEAGILGEYVARRSDPKKSMALQAAYLAMAAYLQAYKNASEQGNVAELNQLIRVANLVEANWSGNPRANQFRMTLGQLFQQQNRPKQAAQWYSKVPPEFDTYAVAQLSAGQSFWSVYRRSMRLPDDQKPPADEIKSYLDAAGQHLDAGIKAMHAKDPPPPTAPEILVAGKLVLAQLHIRKANYQDAVTLMTAEPYPVTKAVAVEDETKRPKKGIQSKDFASRSFQLLLRAYVGLRKLEAARQTMANLEKVGGDDDGAALTSIYVKLGKQLLDELNAAKSDPAKLKELRDSFEGFLNNISERKEGQSFGSLIWIAETYSVFGQGADAKKDASEFYKKASAAYQQMLDRDKTDKKFLSDSQALAVKVRLAKSKRREGDFPAALELVAAILATKPRAIDVQLEGTEILQNLAVAAAKPSPQSFQEAINGKRIGKQNTLVWGWARIALTLQRTLDDGQENSSYAANLLEARYNMAYCRHQSALAETVPARKQAELNKARLEIQVFAAVHGKFTDEWRAKFDKLYQQLQKDQGEKPKPLKVGNTNASAGAGSPK